VKVGLLRAAEQAAKAAAEDAAKAGTKGAEAAAHGVTIENKAGGIEAHGVSAEANVFKVEPRGGGGPGGGGGSGDGDPPVWFYVLLVVGIGGWVVWKFRRKLA
jgi:hypothetical protein